MEQCKITAIRKFPKPRTMKNASSLHGLTRYYRKFIPLYVSIAIPLTDLTSCS